MPPTSDQNSVTLQGETGPRGNTGVGVQGVTGPRGNTGVGVQGVTGPRGNTGVGVQGVTGPRGDTGVGVQGVTGPRVSGQGLWTNISRHCSCLTAAARLSTKIAIFQLSPNLCSCFSL